MRGPSNHSQAVFGPVPSRRLGMSLGLDLVLPKTCSLDCVYCELGPTTNLTSQRAVYRDPEAILAELAQRLGELETPPDFITLAGSGEPTLHSELGAILRRVRELSPARRAVLTNATLVGDPAVRAALGEADLLRTERQRQRRAGQPDDKRGEKQRHGGVFPKSGKRPDGASCSPQTGRRQGRCVSGEQSGAHPARGRRALSGGMGETRVDFRRGRQDFCRGAAAHGVGESRLTQREREPRQQVQVRPRGRTDDCE